MLDEPVPRRRKFRRQTGRAKAGGGCGHFFCPNGRIFGMTFQRNACTSLCGAASQVSRDKAVPPAAPARNGRATPRKGSFLRRRERTLSPRPRQRRNRRRSAGSRTVRRCCRPARRRDLPAPWPAGGGVIRPLVRPARLGRRGFPRDRPFAKILLEAFALFRRPADAATSFQAGLSSPFRGTQPAAARALPSHALSRLRSSPRRRG